MTISGKEMAVMAIMKASVVPMGRPLPRRAWTIASTSALVGTTKSVLTMPNMPEVPSTCGKMWQWKAHTPGRSAVMSAS